jgi:hypothetical protein
VIDRAFVVVDKDGVRTHVPVGGVFVPTIYQQILLDTTGQQKTRFHLLERAFWTLSDFAEL